MIITLTEVKRHLNIETTFNNDDGYLLDLIDVVEDVVIDYLNLPTETTYNDSSNTPKPVKQSMLLMVGHLYLNRQIVSYTQGYEIPYTYKFLLEPYRTAIIN